MSEDDRARTPCNSRGRFWKHAAYCRLTFSRRSHFATNARWLERENYGAEHSRPS